MSAAVAGETALNEPTKLRALKVGCDELADIMEPSRPTMQRTRGSSWRWLIGLRKHFLFECCCHEPVLAVPGRAGPDPAPTVDT